MKNKRTLCASAILAIAWIALLCGCSTTASLPAGEMLYNGMRLNIHSTDGERLPSDMISDLTECVNVRPNNPWPYLTPYRRNPFPIGLWAYNNLSDSARGIKGWLYRKFATPPVLVSEIRPELRLKMLNEILDNNGYFNSKSSYELKPARNPRKGSMVYNIEVGRPYLIDSLEYITDGSNPAKHIDSLARRSRYLVKGERFCVDSLVAERVRIANSLRNRGYYYFKPEFIEFLADSLITPQRVALRLALASNIPSEARLQYRVGEITTYVLRRSEATVGTPDTIASDQGEVVVYRPANLRKDLIPSCISFRRGRIFSVRDMDRTQSRLARLGIFNNIQIVPVVGDTSAKRPVMDVIVSCQFDRPLEMTMEANLTSKSNSYLGPGVVIGVTNNNTFGGGEKLSVKMNANYEWQTGTNRNSIFNSYEFGLTGTLAFPRLLAPNFIMRSSRNLNWTTISLGGDLMNRPHYFKMAEFHTGITYEWNATRNATNQFTPFKLVYNKLMNRTPAFDTVMAANPAVALSFASQFIPQMSYQYTLDKFLERRRINGFNIQASITEAGNIFDGIYKLCGVKGEKRLFGTPFSQFVRGQVQVVYSRRLIPASQQWLVSRVLVGAAHAYGNASQVPYAEQFYIGGANSIRAFTVRSLGPGSYRAPANQRNGYFDQTGTFKFEINSEYRFPIASILHGAAFLDCGNIWLLKNDNARPGGLLTSKNFLRDLALGTGVGLRVDLGMLVVRGDLGYGLHAPYDTGNPGYFNIKFKNAFAFHLAIGYPF